jgi:hypothetical protein
VGEEHAQDFGGRRGGIAGGASADARRDGDKAAPFFIDPTGLDFTSQPPTRDSKSPHYVKATELPDGTLPPAGAEGNFIVGPTHNPAPETVAKDGVPRGTTVSFEMSSNDSTIYNPASSAMTRRRAVATDRSCARRRRLATSRT